MQTVFQYIFTCTTNLKDAEVETESKVATQYNSKVKTSGATEIKSSVFSLYFSCLFFHHEGSWERQGMDDERGVEENGEVKL